jgi:SPRY domain
MSHVHRPWAAGDVIGVCMDLEKGELSFVKNGVNMGGVHLLLPLQKRWILLQH